MTAEEIVKRLAAESPVYCDPEEGIFCFFCGSKDGIPPHYGDVTHKPDCLWLAAVEAAKKG